MKVGLNATCFNERSSGAKQRFKGIYSALIHRLPNAEFLLYEPADCPVGHWFSEADNVTALRTPIPSNGRLRKAVYGSVYWHSVFTAERFDLFECFNEPLIDCPTARNLTTIHDLRRLYSDYLSPERHLYSLSLRSTLAKVDHVITVSESMKSEMHSYYPDARISVVYNGLDCNRFSAFGDVECEGVRKKYCLPHEFLLSVGHFERRKNYLRLLDAIALVHDRGTDCHLVIIGNDSGERRHVEERMHALNLSSCVTLLSGLSDLEVRCIYKISSLFVFPSSYEGFGIPILEAMASGVAPVLSDIPVFREITENRGVYFPHHDVEAMAESIALMLGSREKREELITYGHQRVQEFSFDKLASQLANLYSSFIL